MRPQTKNAYGSSDWFIQEYAKVVDDPWGLSWRPSQALRYEKVLSLLDRIPQECSRILDIGCATGDFTYLLSKHMSNGQTLLGVDFVESAVTRARQRFPSIDFVEHSIFSLGEQYACQFDLVSCLEVLYYIEKEQRSRALKSVKEVLRNKGYAIFSSLISKPPYFTPDQLLTLVASEFQIISSQVLHLKLVSSVESAARRLDKLLQWGAGGKLNGLGAITVQRLPFSTVKALERWCRFFKNLSASHTIVLARAKS